MLLTEITQRYVSAANESILPALASPYPFHSRIVRCVVCPSWPSWHSKVQVPRVLNFLWCLIWVNISYVSAVVLFSSIHPFMSALLGQNGRCLGRCRHC